MRGIRSSLAAALFLAVLACGDPDRASAPGALDQAGQTAQTTGGGAALAPEGPTAAARAPAQAPPQTFDAGADQAQATPDAEVVAVDDAAAPVPEDAAPADASDGSSPPPTTGTCLGGSGDYAERGPYGVETRQVTIGSKGAYTIYYPDPLEEDCAHPFVVWGNGTTITGGTAYDHFHNHAASWGIVSIASHNSNVGDGTFHTAAIDYMLEQNEDASSEFFGKLGARAGVSGHSQGGAGADRGAAMHASVAAIVNVQGSFGTPPQSDAAFLCLTGTDDIQPTGCPRAVRAATVPALCASWDGADHVSTTLREGEGIEQYERLYSAWFRCFLADDTAACAQFMGGAECSVCKEDGWDEIFAQNY